LDVGSEHAIHRALEMVRGETTMIIIAHRLSTLRVCDRIMVLEHGRLQAFESPEVLLGSNAFYRRMSELSVTDVSGPPASTVAKSSVHDA
jgi:ABC-type multidrug transport system fused ATPase/permease subunit